MEQRWPKYVFAAVCRARNLTHSQMDRSEGRNPFQRCRLFHIQQGASEFDHHLGVSCQKRYFRVRLFFRRVRYTVSHFGSSRNRAVGIEYMENPRVQPAATGKITTVRATRLVVISSGAIGSPAILERSGIGSKDVLEKAGVKQLVDLPGVGSEYQG